MNDRTEPNIRISIAPTCIDTEPADRIRRRFGAGSESADLTLCLEEDGLSLRSGDQVLRGDFTRMLPRLKHGLSGELLVRAARVKHPDGPLTAVDATAGLGEDSLLLAASGFHVRLCERNPVIYELLYDAWQRASSIPELTEITARMELFHGDSMEIMGQLDVSPDVILLDPMFPERQKTALVKKKLQIIQKLEIPCANEAELFLAAVNARPGKLIVKRPPKGPYLAEIKPDYSISGKAVRFDCIVAPYDKRHKFNL